MEKRGIKYVFISCLLVVVILCNTAIVFASGSGSFDDPIIVSSFSVFASDYLGYSISLEPFENFPAANELYTHYPVTTSSNIGFVRNAIQGLGVYSDQSSYPYLSFSIVSGQVRVSIAKYPYSIANPIKYMYWGNNTYTSSTDPIQYSDPYTIYSDADYFFFNGNWYHVTAASNSLYYTDISNEESYTNSDGVTFYTGGLSTIALAYPDFYSKLQAAAAGSAGLLEWLVNDIGAMFMLDPSTNDWYILNAPQNVAYYANDSANTITLYSGTVTEDNTFKRDAGSVSFGTSADYWKHNNAVVKYNYQTQQFEYSNTFNGLIVNRGANGVWINRGSSMLALNDPINEQREGLLHGRYVINNPSIGDNFNQYLDNSDDDTTVIDADLYALLNEIKNWSQVDALTQKYLLNTLSEISSFTSEVINYLGPNYLYPTITSYFDSLFRLNGLRYSAYDQNNNKVEYNLHNKSIGDVLTEEYLMLTSIGADNMPAQYYQYDGDVKVNPLYSLWNNIKNLPDNIANKIQPIFPTIPGSNDTIIDSVGDYNNRVSLNPQNVTDTHDNLTDLLSWFHLEGFSGSFSDIFGSSDRWSLWSEETYTNCGLEVDTEE